MQLTVEVIPGKKDVYTFEFIYFDGCSVSGTYTGRTRKVFGGDNSFKILIEDESYAEGYKPTTKALLDDRFIKFLGYGIQLLLSSRITDIHHESCILTAMNRAYAWTMNNKRKNK